jgi:large repetitive protein
MRAVAMRTLAVRAVLLGCIVVGPACAFFTDLDGLSSDAETSTTGDANAPGAEAAVPRDEEAGPIGDGAVAGDGGCPPAPTDPTLVAWYPFEEGAGNKVLDCSSRRGRDGTALASGTFARTTGRVGSALDLGGNGACFDLGLASELPSGLEPFTVAAWIKPRSFGGPPPAGSTNPTPRWFIGHFGNSTGLGRGWGLGTDDLTEVEFKIFAINGAFDETTANIAQNAWTHVAGVWTNGTLRLYVNAGTPADFATALAPALDPGAHAWLGCRIPTEPTYDGLIDDVRIYSRALSAEEIATLAR